MELPTGIPDVMQNASRYFMAHGEAIPQFQKDKIINLMGPGVSPVDFIVCVAEALYAVADTLDVEGRTVAAQAANLCSVNGWHGMTDRGTKMVNALRRMNGETVSQAQSDDPPALDIYIVPPAEPEANEASNTHEEETPAGE